MNNDLMIYKGKNVEIFELNGQVLFNPYDVGECLALSDVTVRRHIQSMNNKQVIKLTNSKVQDMNFRNLHNTGENFLTESGVYKLMLKSKKKEAEDFQDWITDEVLPSIRKTGSYSTNQTKQLTALEQLQLQSEAILEVNTKVDEVINKVNELEDNTTISYGQQEVINRTAKEVVVHALGGKDTPAYKELNKKVFSSFWKDYKRVMQVASYRDTLVKDYDKALDFITAWHPNRDLELMIIGCNAQIEMEEI